MLTVNCLFVYNKHFDRKKKKEIQKSRTMRITVIWDPSRKVNYLNKVIWDRKIITEFTRTISSTRIGKPALMMDVKVSKDKSISRWVDQQNLIYVRWNKIKNCAQRQRWSIEGKKSKTLSEVKPVENISKNLQSFLEISPMHKEVLLSVRPYISILEYFRIKAR